MRNLTFDILRILACILIISMHAPLPAETPDSLFLSALSYFTSPGIGLFFMISGGLLLPMKVGTLVFLRKRLSRILIPTIFWSVFYLLVNLYLGKNVNWAYSLVSLPFTAQGTRIFWFIYTMVGLYLLVPILSRWLSNCSKQEVEFYIFIWGISMCYPLIKKIAEIDTSNTGILYYFSGYIGYFILGYYIKTYPNQLKWLYIAPTTCISIVAPLLCKVLTINVEFYELFWYLSIFVAFLCLFIYKSIYSLLNKISINTEIQQFIILLSNLTFGIYLVHTFIMRYIIWNWDWIINIDSYYIQTFLTILLTCITSTILCYILSFIPGAKYIIGYQRK